MADLLEVADILTAQKGRQNLRKAAMRRAVSSAYYAVFHELCYLCADQLGMWSKANDLLEPVYRLLDHGIARSRLVSKDAAAICPEVLQIGTLFKDLQEARHGADYKTSAMPVSQDWALSQIADARRIVELIEGLSPDDRLKLAILLITKTR
ncbi:hypothetical protein MKL09_29015 [Methylobacterium sp. J-048]|uniref:HEPN domain-containing protein n=1 Tax=Methylobacterium sp. J-048 TaxID=2836635 RepID=UPI001FBB7789|nr:HEPN domain-containing protein [Methylobacterium sp. J-048]MCJ2060554.1 hypothetical protein [Methylobacterium sp. J-048]